MVDTSLSVLESDADLRGSFLRNWQAGGGLLTWIYHSHFCTPANCKRFDSQHGLQTGTRH